MEIEITANIFSESSPETPGIKKMKKIIVIKLNYPKFTGSMSEVRFCGEYVHNYKLFEH